MAQYEFQYAIFRDDQYLADSTTTISLTKKDIKALEDFITEHEFSPLFVDIPAYIYDKCNHKAWDEVPRLCKEIGDSAEPEGLELAFSDHMPLSFIDALDEEIADKVYGKLQEIHPEFFENDEETEEDDGEDEDVEEDEEFDFPEPCKDNTLYMTIKQTYFDQIIAGTKKEEYREIKETTYKKYLECDEEGFPYIDPRIISPEDPMSSDVCCWNNGEYPFIPKESIRYLDLAVGYNKVRDTATVQVVDMTFEPAKTKEGQIARFNWSEEEGFTLTPEGELCVWNIVFHLGDIVAKNIVSKK